MILETTKILIINSRKDQLARSASELNKHGFSVLISDGRTAGYKIAREKSPHLVLHFINNVNEVPAPLNVSEVAAIHASLVVVDTQTLLLPDTNSESGFDLWQGIHLGEHIADTVKAFLESDNALRVASQKLGYRVLVVDDELMNQTYYQEVVRSMGISCDACGDLIKAENYLKATDYDLVITDVLLGHHIGLVLGKVIKELNRKSKLILVTGLSDSEFLDQFGEFECSARLHKPVNPLQLKHAIRAVVSPTKTEKQETVVVEDNGKSRYNPERAFRLLKNNEANIREVMKHFDTYLTEALSIIVTIHDPSQLKMLRKSFHDLGNLCYYFGAEILFEMIGKYSTTQNEHVKFEMLSQITEELKIVQGLHSQRLSLAVG